MKVLCNEATYSHELKYASSGIQTRGLLIRRRLQYAPNYRVNILYKSIAGRYWHVRVADVPITARYKYIKNASWVKPISAIVFPIAPKMIPHLRQK